MVELSEPCVRFPASDQLAKGLILWADGASQIIAVGSRTRWCRGGNRRGNRWRVGRLPQGEHLEDQLRNVLGRSATRPDSEVHRRPARNLRVVKMDGNNRIIFSTVEQNPTYRLPFQRAPRLGVVLGEERHHQIRLFVHGLELDVATGSEQLGLVPFIVKHSLAGDGICQQFRHLKHKTAMLAGK